MADIVPSKPNNTNGSIAVYPGTFDPITEGHIDIINRTLEIFDKVIIAVAKNPDKTPLFSLEERLKSIRQCYPNEQDKISIESVDGLVVDFAYQKGAKTIVRGLRAVSDFDYEFQLALMNRSLKREVETVFFMTAFRWIYISSSIIKDAARHGGDVSGLVPDHVRELLREKFIK